jgi:osmotically-inducible protein OsmY
MIRAMNLAKSPVVRFIERLPLRLAAGGVPGCLLIPCLLAGLLLAGCSPVGTAVGVAATTINLATQERGLIKGVDDNLTWVGINERLLRKDQYLFQKVSLQVHEGRVLLTGYVQKPEDRLAASEIAWASSGVREVMNEIKIGRGLDLGDYSEDAWLINRLRLKLMADRQIRANNFSIDCIRSTIYLMGVAQDDTERQRVIDHARDIAYVREVVSRVRLVSDPLPPVPAQKPTLEPGPVDAPAVATAQAPLPAASPIPQSASLNPSDLPKSTQPASQKGVSASLP